MVLISGVITEGHARALAAIPDTQQMIEAYKMILREGGSVRRAEELSRRFKKSMHRSKPSDGFNTKTVNESIDDMASAIGHSIGENVHVKMRRSRVETAIHIVLKGNPEETESQIQKIYDMLVVPTKKEVQPEEKTEEVVIAETKETVFEETPETVATESTYSNPFEPMLERAPYEHSSDAAIPQEAENPTEY